MTIAPCVRLQEALYALLLDAVEVRKDVVREREHLRLAPALLEFANLLAEGRLFREADDAAHAAAEASQHAADPERLGRRAGRRLTSKRLVETGVASLLIHDPGADWRAVAAELAPVLAGPCSRAPVREPLTAAYPLR